MRKISALYKLQIISNNDDDDNDIGLIAGKCGSSNDRNTKTTMWVQQSWVWILHYQVWFISWKATFHTPYGRPLVSRYQVEESTWDFGQAYGIKI